MAAERMIYASEQFNKLVREFAEKEVAILTWKAGEYTDTIDRLKNFRQVAAFQGRTPAQVASTYLLKHVQSIALAVETGHYVWAWEKEGGEGMKQRFADARNYLLLLAACLDEESQE